MLEWNEKRVRGGHAQFSPWLMHHLLSPADIRFIGLERLPELTRALTGTHASDDSTPLARLVSTLDQQSVEQQGGAALEGRENGDVGIGVAFFTFS